MPRASLIDIICFARRIRRGEVANDDDGGRALLERLERLERLDVSLVGENMSDIMKFIVRAAHDCNVMTTDIFTNFFEEVQKKVLQFRHMQRFRYFSNVFLHSYVYNASFSPKCINDELFARVQSDLLHSPTRMWWLHAGNIFIGLSRVKSVRGSLVRGEVLVMLQQSFLRVDDDESMPLMKVRHTRTSSRRGDLDAATLTPPTHPTISPQEMDFKMISKVLQAYRSVPSELWNWTTIAGLADSCCCCLEFFEQDSAQPGAASVHPVRARGDCHRLQALDANSLPPEQ